MIGLEFAQTWLELSKVRSPGCVYITGAGLPRDWDIRKGYGTSGASVIYTGDNLAKFVATVMMWKAEHLKEWKAFAQLLRKPSLKDPKTGRAQACSHPFLAELEINEVVVTDRTQLQPSPTGLWRVDVNFLQYRKPTPALVRPNGAIPNTNPAQPKAQDAIDIEVQNAQNALNNARNATL